MYMEELIDYSKVCFVLENTETIFFDKNDFRLLKFDRIEKGYTSSGRKDNKLTSYYTANVIKLIIKKQANKNYTSFEEKEYGFSTIFEKINAYNNIVTIQLYNNKDEKVIEFFTNYDGENVNMNQVNMHLKNEDLCIYIS